MLSDRGSTPLSSTRWTLHEHLLFQRRLCCHGVAVMSITEKQGSRLGALTLAFLLFVFLLLLPLGELLLPLFAVIIFSYLWDKEPGKGLYDGLWKLNIISLLPDFLICHSVYLPNIQFSRCVPGPHFLTDPAVAGSPRFTGGPAVFYWVRKRPFTNTAKSTLFCIWEVNISLFLMESLHYGEILGWIRITYGFIRTIITGNISLFWG